MTSPTDEEVVPWCMNRREQRVTRSWWTPTGWRRAPVPAPYTEAHRNAHVQIDYRGARYTRLLLTHREDYDVLPHYCLFLHDVDGHLYVEIWDMGGGVAEFFVAEEDAAAFWVDKYPMMIQARAAARIAEQVDACRGENRLRAANDV